ncbi:hypothetical protein HDV00_009793 [Rhizophlyctis rosea]|nr:hypothetical protein HDV00_009793 [Rhizophlyctis rosea]
MSSSTERVNINKDDEEMRLPLQEQERDEDSRRHAHLPDIGKAINTSLGELDNFSVLLAEMLEKFEKVQEGKMTQEQWTDWVKNYDLARRYYHRTDGGDDPFANSRPASSSSSSTGV